LLVLLHAASPAASPARAAYVATLPTSFAHMPTRWGAARVARLGPLVAPTLRNFCTRLSNEIDVCLLDVAPVLEHLVKTRPDLFPESCLAMFTREWVEWGYANLTSRSFDLALEEEEEEEQEEQEEQGAAGGGENAGGGGGVDDDEDDQGLVPFMDLMNHANTPSDATLCINVEQDKEDGKLYVCARALCDLQEGQELCFSYRLKGDALKFLFNYGFVPDDAQDVFYLMVDFPHDDDDVEGGSDDKEDSDAAAKPQEKPCDPLLAGALQSLGLPGTRIIAIPITDEAPMPDTWLWALRLRAMHLGEDRARFLGNFVSGEQIEMTQAHESSMWSTVAQTLESSLEHYQAAEASAAEPVELRFNKAAVRVLEKAVAKFIQVTGAQ
jgi:hypothetical protein